MKDIPSDVLEITRFLQSNASELKIRKGVINGSRIIYFKGKHASNALLREPFQTRKSTMTISDRSQADEYLQKLLTHEMIFQIEKKDDIKPVSSTVFNPDQYYMWIYQGSQVTGMVMGIGILLLVFVGVMYPLWPPFMQKGMYYISMLMIGCLGALMALGVIRAILWICLVLVLGRGGWLFPNLFADVGVIESFQPVWW